MRGPSNHRENISETSQYNTEPVRQDHDRSKLQYVGSLKHLMMTDLTSTPVPQQVAVDILDVSVDGGPTGDAARGHVGVGLRVDILEALPGNARAKL